MSDCIIKKDEWEYINLDYSGENKFSSFFSSEGNIHSYPAKAVPEMINSLIVKLKNDYDVKTVMDPFLGSGTVALEAKYLGLDFYGSDLNPLAILLSRTKVLTIKNTPYVKKRLIEFAEYIISAYNNCSFVALESFKNIEYWFKEENIKQLSFIKKEIDKFIKNSKGYREEYSLILLTAFSSTIRKSSLTRNGEFKLYRMSPNDIRKFNVDATLIFRERIENLLDMLVVANNAYDRETISKIYLKNAKNLDYIGEDKVDLLITSPPYGDSKSTVAYGQFSRLSLQWMKDLIEKYLNIDCSIENCDEFLLGGNKSNICDIHYQYFYESKTLSKLINDMDKVIEEDILEKRILKEQLDKLIINLNNSSSDLKCFLCEDDILYKLIKERVRLDAYRKINNKKSNLSNKKIKELAKQQSIRFMRNLLQSNNNVKYKTRCKLRKKLPSVMETINRKISTLPLRKIEVVNFLKDLYSVVIESDRVLSEHGIQTWIVGHRTVFGKININMQTILKEWFEQMGYTTVTCLQRKYSFKRLPHHINSTISRNDKVDTMMYEYIIIVKK